jgi:hypothetical protein
VTYVEPVTPTLIKPEVFANPPSTPVVITEEPKYGDITKNTDGSFTYVPSPQNVFVPSSPPIVDVVQFSYTDTQGKKVNVRWSFLVIRQGDVPKVIQTGDIQENSPNLTFAYGAGLMIAMTLIFFYRRARRRHA